MTDDREIIEQIDQLVDEEHALETRHAGDAGLDPDDATERDASTVEGYRQ